MIRIPAALLLLLPLAAGDAPPALNEERAKVTLKAGIHPAQIMYSAGNYTDVDGDGRGEHGLIEQLTTPSRQLVKLPVGPDPVLHGYRYRIYLATGPGMASSSSAAIAAAIDYDAVSDRETYYIAYAWPVAATAGSKVFALRQAGILYQRPVSATAVPAWDDLARGWTDSAPLNAGWTLVPPRR